MEMENVLSLMQEVQKKWNGLFFLSNITFFVEKNLSLIDIMRKNDYYFDEANSKWPTPQKNVSSREEFEKNVWNSIQSCTCDVWSTDHMHYVNKAKTVRMSVRKNDRFLRRIVLALLGCS